MKRILIFAIIFLLSFYLIDNRFINQYLSSLKHSSEPVFKSNQALQDKIEKTAAKLEVGAQDARIDPVWKAIPGYNGLKVDVKASVKKMKAGGQVDTSKLVFKQVVPKVHLSDLPPAPIYKGNQDKPMVSLLINVAWGNEYIPAILAILKKHKVSATFFLEGNWVKGNPDLAKMIAASGHELGNHSYSHPNMKLLTKEQVRKEIQKTNDVIEATVGRNCEWFAPPSGSVNELTIETAHELGLKTVMWSVDTIDWQKPSPDRLLARVMNKVHNGAMILMHPTEPVVKSLDQLIIDLKAKDLEIGTVSELMDEERIVKRSFLLGENK